MEKFNLQDKGMDIRILKITTGYNTYRGILFLITFLFNLTTIFGLYELVNGNLRRDFWFIIISFIITIISLPMIIFAPIYADKIFPSFFRNRIIVSATELIYVNKKKKYIFNLELTEIEYYGSDLITMFIQSIGWSCVAIKLNGKVEKYVSITKKQFNELKLFINKETDL